MPYINIRIGTPLNQIQKTTLCERTTALMNEVLRKKRPVTVVNILETAPEAWAVDGAVLGPNDPPGVYVDIKVTETTNTSEEKSQMIAQTIEMLRDVVGDIQEPSYVVIDDIPADSWGYNGKTQAARMSK